MAIAASRPPWPVMTRMFLDFPDLSCFSGANGRVSMFIPLLGKPISIHLLPISSPFPPPRPLRSFPNHLFGSQTNTAFSFGRPLRPGEGFGQKLRSHLLPRRGSLVDPRSLLTRLALRPSERVGSALRALGQRDLERDAGRGALPNGAR